jgi:hypothetical protein
MDITGGIPVVLRAVQLTVTQASKSIVNPVHLDRLREAEEFM